MNKERQSFTLIELLVVIAILAILSVTVVFVLNPSDLIKQSRDSTRLTDLNNLNKALGLFQVTNPGSFQGTSTVVYVSIPDTTTTCANLGLPTLPTGYTYSCVATSTLAKNDGTGWIPVAFSQISYGSVISRLPTDPINATSSGEYYQYIPGGSWVLTALLTSQKYHAKAIDDNGYDPDRFEIGSSLALNQPLSGLLAAYFQQPGSGLTATDYSNRGNVGTITAGSGGWTTDQHGANNLAYNFDGANTIITASSLNKTSGGLTVTAWVKITSIGNHMYIFQDEHNGGGYQDFQFWIHSSGTLAFGNRRVISIVMSTGQWYFVAGTFDGSSTYVPYINGVTGTLTGEGISVATTSIIAIGKRTPQFYAFSGQMADLRVYNRALSVAEIQRIYNLTK